MEKKNLSMITVWTLLIAAPAVQGAPMHFPDILADQIQNVRSFELNRESISVAENEPKAAENQTRPRDEKQDQAAAPPTAVQENSGSTSDDNAKPLKPFKPSEEIAAEQAVDFPVDI